MKTKINHILFIIFIMLGCSHKQTNEKNKINYPYTLIHQIGNQIDYSLSHQNENISELRMWIIPELTNPKTLVRIKEIDSVTYIQWIHFNYTKDIQQHYKLDSLKLQNRKTNLRIDSLISNLKDLGFDKAQSPSDSIKGLIVDGITYVFEVRQDKYYKAIDCNAPQLFADSNSKKLTEILKFLSKKMNFYYNEKGI